MRHHREGGPGPVRRTSVRRASRALFGGCLAAVLAAGACSGSGTDGSAGSSDSATTAQQPDVSPQPTAPDSDRVDLGEPSFSDPTTIDNPLFPITDLHSALLLGNDGGHPLRIETVLLPESKVIEVDGQRVETRTSQFVAYLDGRIHEVALDWYAQDDDGAVWYFGEDVANYEEGVVADTEGSWVAGEDGPPGMIMPAHPRVGDAYRTENIPGSVFEEVVVKTVDVTVDGPRGPVAGAMVGTENHLLEGHYEDKTFAPGYGEFRSGVGGNLEALAVAVPTDAVHGGVPAELQTISDGADDIFEAADAGNWNDAAASLRAMNGAWAAHQANGRMPPLLAVRMSTALDALAGDPLLPAVEAHNAEGSRNAALDVAQANLDLQLQYRPTTDIDVARLQLWARQLVVDARSGEPDPGNVAGDVSSLGWVWDRIAQTVDDSTADDVDARLDDLRSAADDEDLAAAARAAARFLDTVTPLLPAS